MKQAEAIMKIDIGIDEKQREKIAGGLARLLADSYTLYLKTHNFHWNVTGPMFNTLHLMFETQYNELALAVDLIAERIRALGVAAPGSYREFGKLTSIKESEGSPDANEMIRQLVEGLIYTTIPPLGQLRGLSEVVGQSLAFSVLLVAWYRRPGRAWGVVLYSLTVLVILMSVAGVLAGQPDAPR